MTTDDIINFVAMEYGISHDDIFLGGRQIRIAEARQMSMYLIDHCFDIPVTAIARLFGRTHPTVIHDIRKIRELLPVDRALRKCHDRILQKIKGII